MGAAHKLMTKLELPQTALKFDSLKIVVKIVVIDIDIFSSIEYDWT